MSQILRELVITANILSMTGITLGQKFPAEILADVAQAMRARRKEHRFSQEQLSTLSGVSLGSLKRFESQHQISLESLIKLSIALGCEDDFSVLFARKHYRSIQEVINEQKG